MAWTRQEIEKRIRLLEGGLLGGSGGGGGAVIPDTLLDAKGDLIVATANDTPARQGVGSDGQLLVADSSRPTGIKWAASPAALGWFSPKDYGAVGNGTVDDTVAVHAARDAMAAAGGGTFQFPPGGIYRGAFVFDDNVRSKIIATGATLRPLVGGIALKVNQANGSGAAGLDVDDIHIDGSGVTGATTGLQVLNSDRVTVRGFRIENLTTLVEAKSDASGWVEELALRDGLLIAGTNGLVFNKTATGEGSFGEAVLDNVGINNCAICLSANQNASLYRSSFSSVVFWLDNGQIGMSLDGNFLDADWQVSFEGYGTTGAGTVCIDLLTHAVNLHLAAVQASFVGNYGQDVRPAAGQLLNFRRGTVNVVVVGDGRGSRVFRAGDVWPRFDIQTERPGGGGFGLGDGTASPDVNGWRQAAGIFGTDSDLALMTVGKGLRVKEGTNAKMGTAVLVAGTKVVSTTAVTANSRIHLTRSLAGGTLGHLSYTITAGTSFTINSSSGTDTSTINWLIYEPA